MMLGIGVAVLIIVLAVAITLTALGPLRFRRLAAEWAAHERAAQGTVRLEAAAGLVRGVADGTITAADARSRWPFPAEECGGFALLAWNALQLWDDEADRRERDAKYDAGSRNVLRIYAAKLASDD